MKLKCTKATNINNMACVCGRSNTCSDWLDFRTLFSRNFHLDLAILVVWPRLEILPHARLINEKREFINDWKSYKITSTITLSIARYKVQTLINRS